MTTLTYTTRTPSSHARALPGSAWLPGGRMIRAEFMKQARRRGLMIAAAVLTVDAVIAYFAVEEALHLHNPGQYSPAGGTHGLVGADYILAMLGAVVAILFGASAGAADVTAGVFRNLVTTGRSRAALFLARIPAGLALSIAFTMAGYAVAVASSVLLAGSQHAPANRLMPIPPAQLILAGGGWLILNTVMAYLLSLGLSSVTGSQPITVAVMLALNMFVMPVLALINTLPSVRQLLPGIALYQLQPQAIRQFSSPSLIMSTTMIAVVLTGWAALAVGAGIWRTTSRDA
jgi:ABC-type transport system involved in multi-copper enzyme maturation permease subunit